ncbi:MAG: hypothetical protein M1147_11145 [Nitrospirae bacterium]|nr:hypothetical protein [Nitrospirota bacterium]MCL5978645.1 hypothetical protein [Nitrospirota bacterium]
MQLQDIIEKVKHKQGASARHQGAGGLIVFVLILIAYSLLPFACPVHAQQQPQKQQTGVAQPASQKSLEEERMNILKSDIQKEIEQLKKLKQEIENAQKALDDKTKEKLTQIAKIYEAMPAEEAARKLEKLDDDIAVIILIALKPKNAGKILAQMEADKAAAISKKILIKSKILQEKASQ